ISLSGLTLDGGGQSLPDGRGLVHLVGSGALRIADCTIMGAGGNGISLVQCAGSVTGTMIAGAADNALFALDSHGLTLTGNTIRGSGNGGIRVWQSDKRADGSVVANNRIEDTQARRGGSGENGNAINVFRAENVIVRGNVIGKAAFSAIRGNAASEIEIAGNHCSGLGEVAIYAEFDFEGATIAGNTVDGAALGVVVTNFKQGGRLAVVQGNLIRNLTPRRPQGGRDSAGLGIAVEADSAVTGNVVENAPFMGISVGAGPYQRDVTVSGNVVCQAGIGIGVSVASGAGHAAITGNVIAGTKHGAIVGMDWDKPVTGDLTKAGAKTYPQLTIANNQVS
ncbi:MAG: TIGR03808 family TAT-translocated repetitive protein, partial [Stellaceae bacterium]